MESPCFFCEKVYSPMIPGFRMETDTAHHSYDQKRIFIQFKDDSCGCRCTVCPREILYFYIIVLKLQIASLLSI